MAIQLCIRAVILNRHGHRASRDRFPLDIFRTIVRLVVRPTGSASSRDPMEAATRRASRLAWCPSSHVATYRRGRWDELGVKRNALVQGANEAFSWGAR